MECIELKRVLQQCKYLSIANVKVKHAQNNSPLFLLSIYCVILDKQWLTFLSLVSQTNKTQMN